MTSLTLVVGKFYDKLKIEVRLSEEQPRPALAESCMLFIEKHLGVPIVHTDTGDVTKWLVENGWKKDGT